MCRFFLELPMDRALAKGKKRRVARDLYEKKEDIYLVDSTFVCTFAVSKG